MPQHKYFLSLPTKAKDSPYTKDCGFDPKLASKLAHAYFNADKNNRISLIEQSDRGGYLTRLPNPEYIESPANCNESWIYLSHYPNRTEAIEAVREYSSNDEGTICIISDDFLEEFREVHLVLKLRPYSEYPHLDMENLTRSGVVDEFMDELIELRDRICTQNSGSAFNLIESIDWNIEATDATQIN